MQLKLQYLAINILRTHKSIFVTTQKYFSWPAGKNLKGFEHYCKKMTENGAAGEVFVKKTSKMG